MIRPLRDVVPSGSMLGQRVAALLAMVPQNLPPRGPSEAVYKAVGARRHRVALLTGCAQTVLAPEINQATIRLLTRLGVEVVVPPDAGCCGALTHHIGKHDQAMASARANITAWCAAADREGLDAVVVNTSGCGTTVKDYGFMFRNEPSPWRERAERIAAMTLDISQYLTRIGYEPTRAPAGLTVAYHSACSLQHGQVVNAEPRALLQRAGFTVREPIEAHLCCGSAGTYNLLQPAIAGRLRERKLENLQALRPDLIAAGNIGCIKQLSGDGVPVLHTVELLDWMAGGPEPAGIGRIMR